MTDYEKGFMSKCAELGMDGSYAEPMCKFAQEHKPLFDRTGQNFVPFFKDMGMDFKDMFNTTKDHVMSDPVNKGVMPMVTGGLAGAAIGNLLHSDDPDKTVEENRRRRNLKMLIGALLAGGAATVANAHGYGNKLIPQIQG